MNTSENFKKLKKVCIARSKVHFVRKYFLVVISCLMLSIVTYCFIDRIVDVVQNYYFKTATCVSEFLINRGFVADKIIIEGNKAVKSIDIIKLIDSHKPIIFISLSKLKHTITAENKWIKNITIQRLLPDTLQISIREYKPFANWYHHNKYAVIDSHGYVIIENVERDDLVSIYGDDALSELHFVQEILNSDSGLNALLSSFSRVSNRRWNIIFTTGLEVKLPEDNPYSAWNYLLHLYKTSSVFLDWKVIDMRIPDKIFIRK